MSTSDLLALEKIGNLTPGELREIIYVHSPLTHRRMVKRLYRTRGALIAEVFSLYLGGKYQPSP